ncbi:MAG: multidrug ABC transporter ATP-binding protein [Bacteroidetes bacterium]|nr:multidrug ABC transporter ATP-binding protein [Bacteroidota bacterium]|tara:strand:- start:44 stop:727 length:684 start_codon:yes stop_codon:yes gene_type:complete
MDLVLNNVSKSFGDHQVLRDIDLEIKKGEIIGLLGKNGAGKTTFLNLIAGLLKPDSGTIKYGELDYSSQLNRTKSKIGYLSERNPLYDEMYVQESLNFVRNLSKSKIESLEQLIDKCELKEVLGKKVSTLSKGYRQRLGLAQSLLHEPELLLLDEPSSGLDPKQQQSFYRIIEERKQNGIIIFSSHILSDIQSTADRILLIDNGIIEKDIDKNSLNKDVAELERFFS